MRPRTLQRWILWLLPLMVLRAFVPAGFMVAAHSGELSLVFCSSVPTAVASSGGSSDHRSDHSSGTFSAAGAHHDHAEHHSSRPSAPSPEHHAHHGAQSDTPEHTASGANSCPFALTAFSPAPKVEFFTGHPAPQPYPQRFSDLLFSSHGPQRTDSIRGPPAFI